MADIENTEAPADNNEGNEETTTTTRPTTTTEKPVRATLSDEEQLTVLEGRLKRLKTKLGRTEEPTEVSKPDQGADLSQKAFLRSAGIADKDEVELALATSKKWGMNLDDLVDDDDFKDKLDKLRTKKSNDIATEGVNGDGTRKGANTDPAFWMAKGVPPTAKDIPDRATRAKIVRAMIKSGKNNGKKFYND